MVSKSNYIFIIILCISHILSEIDYGSESLKINEKYKGKLSIKSRVSIQDQEDLSIVYTPGVAEPCKKIYENKALTYKYTIKGRTLAVISDGSSVLDLGDIGPEAALPLIEGKALLFKEFGEIDAFPICLGTKDPKEIIKTVKYISPTFGGINLEDISAPKCLEIEETLKEELNIPVFNDNIDGISIAVLAGIINSLKIVKKRWKDLKIVISGTGVVGLSIFKLLMHFNPEDIILANSNGTVYEGKPGLSPILQKYAKITNKYKQTGTVFHGLAKADIFIVTSGPKVISKLDVRTMKKDSIIFALSDQIPENMPEEAFAGGARIVATGRGDFPNQISNILVFPGLFKGALMVRSTKIVEDMKIAAANALASLVHERELNEKYIIPDIFDKRCAKVVAEEVATVAEYLGLAQAPGNREW